MHKAALFIWKFPFCMLKKILRGYGHFILFVLKLAFLLFICVASGAAIVFPLWKFATVYPHLYSVVICLAAAALLIWFVMAKTMMYLNSAETPADKKRRKKKLAAGILRTAIVAGGMIGCIFLVLYNMRIWAAILVLAAIVLYGIVTYGLSDSVKNS